MMHSIPAYISLKSFLLLPVAFAFQTGDLTETKVSRAVMSSDKEDLINTHCSIKQLTLTLR